MIACRTVIGFGMPGREGTQKAHSDAPGADVVEAARRQLQWDWPPFVIPDDLLQQWRAIGAQGAKAFADWKARKSGHDRQQEFDDAIGGVLPPSLGRELAALKQKLIAEKTDGATRKLSEKALEVINTTLSTTVGGSADLTPSNNTKTRNLTDVKPGDFAGRYIHYGIREHGMAAAMNGMALHGGIIPYGGTFLAFSDYCRPSIRLAALMGAHVVFVMTHDSIGLGEDGPTHQPVEHLAALRAIPNLLVFRPADGVETAECWQIAMEEKSHASVMALSRQDTGLARQLYTEENLCRRGAYILQDAAEAKITLLATGTEVALALRARDLLGSENIAARVVSMPCWALFEQQDRAISPHRAGNAAPPCNRGSLPAWLGPLYRRKGRLSRDAWLRRQRPGKGCLFPFRDHRRGGGPDGEGSVEVGTAVGWAGALRAARPWLRR